MKQKTLQKAATILLLSVSLGSFLYVNTDICLSGNRNLYKEIEAEAEICAEESHEAAQLPVPAVNILSHLMDLAQRFTGQ